MRHRVTGLLLSLSIIFCGIAQAGEGARDALSAIPGDVMGVVFVPSPKQLDADYQAVVNKLGLQMFAPPSLLSFVKMQLPVLQSMDDSGVFALMFMPAEDIGTLQKSQVLMVPTTDVKGMLEALGGQESEGNIWAVNLMGQPAYGAAKGHHLVIAETAEAVKAVLACESNLAATMKPTDLKAMEGVDIGVWVNGKKLMGMLKPLIDGFLPMMMMNQPPAAAEMNKQNIDMFVEGLATLGIGVLLDEGGLGLRFAMTTKDGSEFGKRMKMKPTTGSLLKGLQGGKYILASGQTVHPDQAAESVKQIDSLFAMAGDVEGLNQEKMTELKNVLAEWAPTLIASRMAVHALTPGPDGLIGLSVVIKTKDSKQFLGSTAKVVGLAKGILADFAKGEDAEEWLKKVSDIIVHVEGAEEIAGTKVDHFKLDLSKTDEIDEEDIETALKIIGKDGLLLRMASVDEQTVAVAFGGGQARMGTVMEHAKKDDALLDDDAGVKKVASHLPESRASVMYVALDQVVAVVNNVLGALEEERLPIQVPELNAPVAIAATGGDGWTQVDFFLPADLLDAAKNAALAMMGNAMAAPPEETAEETPPAETGEETPQ